MPWLLDLLDFTKIVTIKLWLQQFYGEILKVRLLLDKKILSKTKLKRT